MKHEHKKQLGAIKSHVRFYRGIPDETGKTRRDNKKYQEELTKLFEDLTAKFNSLTVECEKEEKKIKQSRKMAELEQHHLAMAMALTQQPRPRSYNSREASLFTELKKSTEYQARIQSLNKSEEALRKRIQREGEQHIKDFKAQCALLMKSYADLLTCSPEENMDDDEKPEQSELEKIEDGMAEIDKVVGNILNLTNDLCTE